MFPPLSARPRLPWLPAPEGEDLPRSYIRRGWEEYQLPNGSWLFRNVASGEVLPYRHLGAWERREENGTRIWYNRRTGQKRGINDPPEDYARGDWAETRAPDGRRYYFNKNTRETRWEAPNQEAFDRYHRQRRDPEPRIDSPQSTMQQEASPSPKIKQEPQSPIITRPGWRYPSPPRPATPPSPPRPAGPVPAFNFNIRSPPAGTPPTAPAVPAFNFTAATTTTSVPDPMDTTPEPAYQGTNYYDLYHEQEMDVEYHNATIDEMQEQWEIESV